MTAVETVKEKLTQMARPVDTAAEIEQVATISANGDKSIGSLISKAMEAVGKDGVITIKTGKAVNDEFEMIEGMKFNRGFISPYFVNSHKGPKVEYNDAYVLFSEKKISHLHQILPAIEIANTQKKPLIIVAEDLDPEPLSVLVVNKLKIGLPVAAVKAPGFGQFRKDTLLDMAVATGGVVFEDDTNLIRLEDCIPESLGQVGEAIITKDSTLFLKGKGLKYQIDQRIDEINAELANTTKDFDKDQLIERVSRLKAGVAVLHIGGCSEVEANEKKDRVNDALNATRAAISEGIVPGGGIALIRCIPTLEQLKPVNNDQAMGIEIVKKALITPCVTIVNNAGCSGQDVVSDILLLGNDFGFDVLTKDYVNMFDKGIIDPAKVVRRALTDASGVASLLTTAEAVICDLPKNLADEMNVDLNDRTDLNIRNF